MKQRRDRLLAALIAKLPAAGLWDSRERIAWLRMMATAFDVAYGAGAPIRITPMSAPDGNAAPGCAALPESSLPAGAGAIALPPRRFYVDRDGFAMADGKPIAAKDLPENATLWDERVGLECGDLTTILWRDIGTTRQGLPPGVTLITAADARPPGSNRAEQSCNRVISPHS